MFVAEKKVPHSFRYNRGLCDFSGQLTEKGIESGAGWGTVWRVFLTYKDINTES